MTAPVGGNSALYAESDYYRIIDQAAPVHDGLDATHNAFQSVTSLPYFVTEGDAFALAQVADLGTMAYQDANAVAITGGTITGITDLAVADGGTGASTPSAARANLGLAIGSDVQAWDANLDQIAALSPTADNIILGNGSAWTLATPSGARVALGLVIGVDVQAHDSDLDTIAGFTPTADNFIVGGGAAWTKKTPSQARTSLGLSSSDSPSFTNVVLSGYLSLAEQAAPSTPTNAIYMFADTSNRLSWKGENGFVRTFDGTSNTADRIYVLPDQAGTVGLYDNTPGSNSTSRFVWRNAAGTAILNLDTANGFVGVGSGNTDPQAMLHTINGALVQIDGDLLTPWFSAGGYTNFISQSNTFTNASWTKTGVTAAATASDPAGTANGASNIGNGGTSTDGLSQTITNSTTGAWTFSVWMKSQAGTVSVDLNIATDGETPTKKTIVLTTIWKRYFVTQTLSVAHTTKTVSITNGTNGAIAVFRAQLDNSAYMRGYATTTTSAITTAANIFRFFTAVTFDTTLQANSTATFTGGASITGTGFTFSGAGAAASPSTFALLSNATAATSGVPVQAAPYARWLGHGWDTGAGGSDKAFGARVNLTPVTGNPAYATLDFQMDPNTGSFANAFQIFSLGAHSGVMDTMTYSGTITLDVQKGNVHKTTTVNATGNATINASTAGQAGQHMWVLIANDATSGKTITFGTNFLTTGTIVGTVSKSATIHFISDGTAFYEVSRTLVL
jgi:hypothetical protein